MPADEVERKFTGVALTFSPGATFARGRSRRHSLHPYVGLLAQHWPALAQVLLYSVLLQALVLLLRY